MTIAIPGGPVTPHERGWRQALRERRHAATEARTPKHLRDRRPEMWSRLGVDWKQGYQVGWTSTVVDAPTIT